MPPIASAPVAPNNCLRVNVSEPVTSRLRLRLP
jgi:hypothetical protein